ncbi:MAG: CinA family nicotinamide mononucleotide deamidase-related protein, partial [Phycisphaerales bacterium]
MSAPTSNEPRRVAVLSVGDELVLGQIEDTNASWIARELQRIGCMPGERRTVADDRLQLARAMHELSATHGALIVTGGLGPTLDDLTREALLDVVDAGGRLETDPAGVDHLRGWFERRGRAMPASNLRQAMRPRGAWLLGNPNGTAPGIAARIRAVEVFCLPGPPNEMRPMFTSFVEPALSSPTRAVLTTALHTIGVGESTLAERLGELMRRDRQPSVGTTASDGIVSIRVRSEGAVDEARMALAATVADCERAAGSLVYGRDGEPLAEVVGRMLLARGLALATVESCTGGLVGAMVTDVAGSSAWYLGGFVTYSNERKMADVAVRRETLEAHGAVSAQTACEMARGCLSRTGADVAIATTGVAGPSGGRSSKRNAFPRT